MARHADMNDHAVYTYYLVLVPPSESIVPILSTSPISLKSRLHQKPGLLSSETFVDDIMIPAIHVLQHPDIAYVHLPQNSQDLRSL